MKYGRKHKNEILFKSTRSKVVCLDSILQILFSIQNKISVARNHKN
jgi:hypothetical protein